MAATLQQHCATNGSSATRTTNTATNPNPQLKRLVYSKYRELLGSYNDQANAYIETLPSYMVQKDTGFNLELKNADLLINSAQQNGNVAATHHQQNEMYGAGQRMPAQQTYEAPACVQNAMMTKDKKPFTYTPGGIDLSQIKSERMAKRLARNAQAEGATGIQQKNRPAQPQSPGGSSPGAASAAMGAAAMGMPFQVLPPPPPPSPGKSFNGGSARAPPPPPSSSNFSNVGTLAPPSNGNGVGGRGSAPNSPSMPRKSPTPQRFEPPPMGFRPEIKIPPNPMAALRKVPPPVEKNTFWKDEYVKERSKSPMVDNNDSVNSNSSSPQSANANNNGTAMLSNDNIDGVKKTMPTTTTNNSMQQNQTNNNYTNYEQPLQKQQQQQLYTPPTQPQQPQQSPIRPLQQSPQYGGPQPPTAQLQQTHISPQQTPHPPPPPPQQQQPSYRPEFRSVAAPTSPVVNVYTKPSDSPRPAENATPPRATESPFKFAQQQQQQQQRAPPTVSPLVQQQSMPSTASSGASVSPHNPAQTVPWRTQRGPSQPAQPPVVAQSHPQPIYNNVQQQAQRTPDFSTQQSAYQGPKPTNVGSLYIAPLAPPTEPQAPHIVRQQMQQHRDSPVRQTAPHQQQQQPSQQLRWMSSQPMHKEQPAWARPEENGNVIPSSLNRIKSPPPQPPATSTPTSSPSQATHQMYHHHQPLNQDNGFMPQTGTQNFGGHPTTNTTGLRLQINTPINNQANGQNAPKERIIPIQLEQTPTYTPAQPSFNHGPGSNQPGPGYVMRTPNQFVDQGYNNFAQQQQQQQQQQQTQRVISPTLQQLNAPRMVQQTQNNTAAGNKTHIIPITVENNEGTRGLISNTPIVIQNDQRTPPVQSKSFRILQKITDTIDDGTNGDSAKQQQRPPQQQHVLQEPIEPQLQRPTFARQMSAQQARQSPTVEQMRRMQIGHEQGNYSAPTTPSAFVYKQQRPFYDNSQKYVPPSEQQVTEPKKYTGSAIPSRSFKILQAMTQPENADKIIKEKQENCAENNEINEIESKPESNSNYNSCASNSSGAEPALSSSSTTINSELIFSSSSTPTPPPTHPMPYPPYPYPYGYPWYLPPPAAAQNSEHYNPQHWHYPYAMPATVATPPIGNGNREQSAHYPPYPYYYPYYPPPHTQNISLIPTHAKPQAIGTEYDIQNMYPSYMPPPHPYLAYPYPVAPSYSQGSDSSRASSVLPDIIITPSTDDVPSKVIMQHHIQLERQPAKKRASSIDIEDVISLKSNYPAGEGGGAMVDILSQQLENVQMSLKNNLNTKCQVKKYFRKNIEQKSPDGNGSPIQITMVMTESEREMDETSTDSEKTPKQVERKEPIPLKSIKSVNNVQIYKGKAMQQLEPKLSSDSDDHEDDDDDETTADEESDIFDEEDEDEVTSHQHDCESEQDSETEEFLVDDNLSVIYEEESEMERSSNRNKIVGQNENKNEENVKPQATEEEPEDSTSVTVRLPLKFSFSSSTNDEKIATLEVGKSQVEGQRSTIPISEKRNSFSVASIKSSDSEDDDDDDELEDCDVSVTISLSQSSKSSSLDLQQVYKNMDHLYPLEDMPLPEKVFEKTEESTQEDVSVSFSLNMRNKFSNETNKDGVTNNIAMIADDKGKARTTADETEIEVSEELDFFATLRATKMQAQKIKEQSASYWGKSQEKPAEPIETNEENSQEKTENKENKVNGKKKNLKKTKSKGKIITKADELKANEEMKITERDKVKDTQEKYEKSKFSFWDRCSSGAAERKTQEQEYNKQTEDKEAVTPASINTSKNFTNQNQEDIKNSVLSSANTHLNSPTMELCVDGQETEEIADIWAGREEDLPPIKPIKRKLKSLENASQSFWSSVYETAKETEKVNEKVPQKPSMQAEMINQEELNVPTLRYSIKELCHQPQHACEDFAAVDEELEDSEESEEVDFWAEINSAKLRNSSASKQEPSADSYTYAEQEYNVYNQEEHMATPREFDPYKYPEEPREVDTDEEIDFWAEIEAKRQAEDDDVTFHKSASFWAYQERQNSVDETPYKPVLPKAFHAKLPDDPPSANINIWAALEAYKGEEPVIIDPVQEEEQFLAQQYEVMITNQQLNEEEELNDETISAHEPLQACAWSNTTENPQEQELAIKMWNQETLQDITQKAAPKTEIDELEIKRSNYRKAMAFFTTSIDENKEQHVERYESGKSKYGRNSACIEEENEKWDWDAVNEALEQEKGQSKNEISTDIKDSEVKETEQIAQTVVAGYNNRLCKLEGPENNGHSNNDFQNNNICKGQTEFTKTPVIPEARDLKEVRNEPAPKRLLNGLPDLEVKKFNEDRKISVKDRITAFETGSVEKPSKEMFRNLEKQCLSVESNTRQSSLSRNSSTQRSESEMDEDDSGVTDMNKQLSETDTEPESFPELRKMSSYQRAATHSRLFKLLQEDPDVQETHKNADEYQFKPSRKKIVHNVSITRKQNPSALADAETMSQRRERLSLPLRKNTSIDNDNPSTPNSPASPIMGHADNNKSPVVNEKLVNELVQSLLLKSDSTQFRKLPMEKLQAAAKRVLEEELDSLENTSIDSTPALTPSEMKKHKSYNDYYNTWSDAMGAEDIVPSKSFRALQDSRRSPWTARCPRVLSSKTINRDLARVTESPEISANTRQSREPSVGKWKKS